MSEKFIAQEKETNMSNRKREEFITILNGALKDQFDFVPLCKAIKIADVLLTNGATIPVRCTSCLHGDRPTSYEKQTGKEPSPEKCYCNFHNCVVDPDYFCGFGKVKE
jgi:hypothetical protein